MINFLENIKNIIDFKIRKSTKFSRKNYSEKNEPKYTIFKTLEELERENQLLEKYNLIEFKNNSTKSNYFENLYYLDILDKYLKVEFQGILNVLDIGSKNWSYVKSEYFFFQKKCNKLILDGIELDSHRLYPNLYSRKEVANFHIKHLPNTTYIENDFLKNNKKYDYIIWILPFIKKYPHLKWGLPLEYFKPNEMLQHAYSSLNENGQILIINQGKEEFEIQKQLCKTLKINIREEHKIETTFKHFKMERYIINIKKERLD